MAKKDCGKEEVTMIKKLTAFLLLALTATMSQALILNWQIENCPWASKGFSYAQLVAVYTGSAEEKGDRPDSLYSWYIALEADGVHEDMTDPVSEEYIGSLSELNLNDYMTATVDGSGATLPQSFDFNGYSFYFQVLDSGYNPVVDKYGKVIAFTTDRWWMPNGGVEKPDGIMASWDDLYHQYTFDATDERARVWVVGVPEPCSVTLMMLGVSAILLRRRVA